MSVRLCYDLTFTSSVLHFHFWRLTGIKSCPTNNDECSFKCRAYDHVVPQRAYIVSVLFRNPTGIVKVKTIVTDLHNQ